MRDVANVIRPCLTIAERHLTSSRVRNERSRPVYRPEAAHIELSASVWGRRFTYEAACVRGARSRSLAIVVAAHLHRAKDPPIALAPTLDDHRVNRVNGCVRFRR